MAEKSAPHRSERPSARDAVNALSGWLHDELAGTINVYHLATAAPCPAATFAHRFNVSVRAAAVADLLLLRNVRDRDIGTAPVLTIVQIEALGPVQSRGDMARREFVIHFREQR